MVEQVKRSVALGVLAGGRTAPDRQAARAGTHDQPKHRCASLSRTRTRQGHRDRRGPRLVRGSDGAATPHEAPPPRSPAMPSTSPCARRNPSGSRAPRFANSRRVDRPLVSGGSMSTIQISHLSKSYGVSGRRRPLARGARPSVYGLLGPNGAGKTTTFKCMLGLSRANGGDVLRRPSPGPETFARIAYVPERSVLYEWMTVDEHVEMNRRAFARSSRRARGSCSDSSASTRANAYARSQKACGRR